MGVRAGKMVGFGKVLKQHVDEHRVALEVVHSQNSSLRRLFFLSVESIMKQVLHLLQPISVV